MNRKGIRVPDWDIAEMEDLLTVGADAGGLGQNDYVIEKIGEPPPPYPVPDPTRPGIRTPTNSRRRRCPLWRPLILAMIPTRANCIRRSTASPNESLSGLPTG